MNICKGREVIKQGLLVLLCLPYVIFGVCLTIAGIAGAGQPATTTTQELSGTAPVGAYTFPANFSAGRSPGADKTVVGLTMTHDQLTNPATEVELIVELSYDGGVSWPPECVSAATCLCHDATQDAVMPAEATWCSIKTRGGTGRPNPSVTTTGNQCYWSRATDDNTRLRARLNVCGASATGTISSTWR